MPKLAQIGTAAAVHSYTKSTPAIAGQIVLGGKRYNLQLVPIPTNYPDSPARYNVLAVESAQSKAVHPAPPAAKAQRQIVGHKRASTPLAALQKTCDDMRALAEAMNTLRQALAAEVDASDKAFAGLRADVRALRAKVERRRGL